MAKTVFNVDQNQESIASAGSANATFTVQLEVGADHRDELTVVELVFDSVAWGLICSAWGASVAYIYTDNLELRQILRLLHPTAELLPLHLSIQAQQGHSGSDVLVATCRSDQEIRTACEAISLFVPRLAILGISSNYTRKELKSLTSPTFQPMGYGCHLYSFAHEDVGGATEAEWKFLSVYHRSLRWTPPTPHTPPLPPVTIFNMIDDKIGGGFGVIPKRAWGSLRDSSSRAWDLGSDPSRTDYWVRCPSVYSPSTPIVRRLGLHELAALWDFTIPSSLMTLDRQRTFLSSILSSPPGKMLRKVGFSPLRYLWGLLDLTRTTRTRVNRHINYIDTGTDSTAILSSHLKAAKADDAPIDFEMWAWPNETQRETMARDLLRLACHSFWRLKLLREAIHWLLFSPDSIPSERAINIRAIVDCITRAANSSFWEWLDGSRLFFWRWRWWWKSARDGEILFKLTDSPKWMGKSYPTDTWEHELSIRDKEAKLVHRRYVELGFVDCMTPRFGVPKSDSDVRLVWDATRNGVNATLWAPSFWMPTFLTLQDLIIKRLPCSIRDYFAGNVPVAPGPSDWRRPHQSDMDVGEMFLNYMMHWSDRHMFGVRIKTGKGASQTEVIMRFCRLMFGGNPCPYLAVQGHARCMELVCGDHTDPTNPLHWTSVIENYPFTRPYDPSMPRVIRVREDGEMAAGTPSFVDDGRITGVNEEICDAATHRFCTRINYFGEQNASRKRRPRSQKPGAWTGKMLWTDEDHPRKSVLPEKWKAQRENMLELKRMIEEGREPERKLFLSVTCRGMSQTEVYWDLRPYYKSFYNALERWR